MDIRLVLLAGIYFAIAWMCSAEASDLSLTPWPKNVTMSSGTMLIPKQLTITAVDDEALRVARVFAEDLEELGFAPVVTNKPSKSAHINLTMIDDPMLDREGYKLSIANGIRIAAHRETGLFLGTRTALQIFSSGPDESLPKLSIWDKPDFPYRALMVDTARHFHSVEFHKRMIKRLASLKMNIYHIHFTDDQSWTLPSDKYPKLPTPNRSYTKEELNELVILAAHYRVTIVPEIDIPGHSKAFTSALPDTTCRPGKSGNVICPSSEKARQILEDLISEAMDIFPGPFFHIGADEVDTKGWSSCSECKALKNREGFSDDSQLYNYFINRTDAFVASHGRRTIVWEGFRPATQPVVNKGIIVEQFENAYAQALEYVSEGYDLINASWSPLYVVQNRASSASTILGWEPTLFGRNLPSGLQSISEMTKIEPTDKLRGISICSWENTEAAEEPILLGIGTSPSGYVSAEPRLQAAAERAWTAIATK